MYRDTQRQFAYMEQIKTAPAKEKPEQHCNVHEVHEMSTAHNLGRTKDRKKMEKLYRNEVYNYDICTMRCRYYVRIKMYYLYVVKPVTRRIFLSLLHNFSCIFG